MKNKQKLKILFCLSAVTLFLISGCVEKKDTAIDKDIEKSRTKITSGQTIGPLCRIVSPDTIAVSGYALVGGLRQTGSSECPPAIRDYLAKYISKYLPNKDVNQFINSKDTSVVLVEGLMPTSPVKGKRFDVRVVIPQGTQTTSLEGGRLYGAELKAAGTFGVMSRKLAYAEGPVYIDKIAPTDEKTGYILNGGVVLNDYSIILSLLKPDFLTANSIRNKLIERFGSQTAKAISPGQIDVKVPPAYLNQKRRFISIIKSTYLNLTPDDKKKKIKEFVSELSSAGDADAAEIALEAIGKDAVVPLKGLLKSTDDSVRFRAGRCLLNIGSDLGFSALREYALDDKSPFNKDAFNAISNSAAQGDIAALSRRLLNDENRDTRLAAYKQLSQMDDIAITSEVIAGDFILDRIGISKKKMVFVSRSGTPRIAIFAGPIYCAKNLFVQSDDGNIIINGLPDQNFVSVIRHIPHKAEIGPISLKCSYELSDIIRTLGSEPVKKTKTSPIGLGVSYCQVIGLLNKLVAAGAIDAEFYAGPMPEISLK